MLIYLFHVAAGLVDIVFVIEAPPNFVKFDFGFAHSFVAFTLTACYVLAEYDKKNAAHCNYMP